MFLSLVFHNHQPVGQLPWSFEDAWCQSYAPFLEVLNKHPKVKVALHFTGPLLDWLVEHKPQTIAQIRNLVAQKQIEILSGGYYEPILVIWPHDDQAAQLRKLNARVEEIFGCKPRGMWLAERVWEPQLAIPIRQAGLQYTFIDGTVFEAAGVSIAQSFDVFQVAAFEADALKNDATQIEYSKVVSDGQEKLAVFPINQPLRHIIPWHDGAQSVDYLRGIHNHEGDDAVVVFADDGEKFGGWPGTFKFIYQEGWLERFFTLLDDNADWLRSATPSEIVDARFANTSSDTSTTRNELLESAANKSAAHEVAWSENAPREVVLPSGSYSEMQDWSGGNWRNFLARYRESRDIYEEVLRVRELIQTDDSARDSKINAPKQKAVKTHIAIENVTDLSAADTDSESAASAREKAGDLILQAQSNDPLWHGVFGGLYLRHLRQALYAKTIEAQVLVEGDKPFVRVTQTSAGELTLENELVRIGVRPIGGHIWNWTSKASRHNVLSTLRRYREPYHTPDSPEDWYPRAALLDHFLGDTTTLENFAQTRFAEQGDFISELWHFETQSSRNVASICLTRRGGVWTNGLHQPVTIDKTLTLRPSSTALEIEYSIRNASGVDLDIWWANEWNVAMSGTDAPTRHYHGDNHKAKLRLDETASFWDVTNPIVADSWLGLQAEWNFSHVVAMWHIPINSVSQKEGGAIELMHQSSAFVFLKRLHMPRDFEYSMKFTAALNSERAL